MSVTQPYSSSPRDPQDDQAQWNDQYDQRMKTREHALRQSRLGQPDQSFTDIRKKFGQQLSEKLPKNLQTELGKALKGLANPKDVAKSWKKPLGLKSEIFGRMGKPMMKNIRQAIQKFSTRASESDPSENAEERKRSKRGAEQRAPSIEPNKGESLKDGLGAIKEKLNKDNSLEQNPQGRVPRGTGDGEKGRLMTGSSEGLSSAGGSGSRRSGTGEEDKYPKELPQGDGKGFPGQGPPAKKDLGNILHGSGKGSLPPGLKGTRGSGSTSPKDSIDGGKDDLKDKATQAASQAQIDPSQLAQLGPDGANFVPKEGKADRKDGANSKASRLEGVEEARKGNTQKGDLFEVGTAPASMQPGAGDATGVPNIEGSAASAQRSTSSEQAQRVSELQGLVDNLSSAVKDLSYSTTTGRGEASILLRGSNIPESLQNAQVNLVTVGNEVSIHFSNLTQDGKQLLQQNLPQLNAALNPEAQERQVKIVRLETSLKSSTNTEKKEEPKEFKRKGPVSGD